MQLGTLPPFAAAVLLVSGATLMSAQTIRVEIVVPTVNYVETTNRLYVRAAVTSGFQVQSVTASVADRQATLTFSQVLAAYEGTLDLTGLARGARDLLVAATDVQQNRVTATRAFSLDRPPIVSVPEPIDFTVSRGTVRVRATCVDDDPAGCKRLTATITSATASPLGVGADAISEIDRIASVNAFNGQSINVVIRGTDSADRTTVVQRAILVDSTPRLREVTSVAGLIYDFDSTRILYAETSGATATLKIRDRRSGLDTGIPASPGKTPKYGFLSPKGAIFVVEAPNTSKQVVEFWNGQLLSWTASLRDLRVRGNYAIWSGERIFFRDLTGDALIAVPTGTSSGDVAANTGYDVAANAGYDVAANGDVVYSGLGVRRYRYWADGSIITLPHVEGFWEMDPVTDGINVAYSREHYNPYTEALTLLAGAIEMPLDAAGIYEPRQFRDYRLENGWTAFTINNAGRRQVWTRSPVGVLRQLPFDTGGSAINALNAQGDTIIESLADGGRYLIPAGTGQPTRSLMSRQGNWRWIDGAWFVAIGRSIFDATGRGPTTVYPATGPMSGGTTVTIAATGFGMSPMTTVTFGGVPATAIQWIDETSLRAVVPPHAAGGVDVTVVSAGVSGTLASGYRYLAPPTNSTVDSDGDRLPDAWEQRYGLDSEMPFDPNLDPDGDGRTNLQEYQADTHPNGVARNYLAEGATSPFFATRIALFNPSSAPAAVLLTYLPAIGAARTQFLSLPPLTRATVDAADTFGAVAAEFSTTIETDRLIVIDRTMTWDKANGYGSHADRGTPAAAATWYLAEGATHSGFNLFYLLQNPVATHVNVEVTYLLPAPSPPLVRTYVLTPSSRRTIWVNAEAQSSGLAALAATDVSAVVRSLQRVPIIVERAMYLDLPGQTFGAGHGSAGVTAPATDWFFAEGATGAYFDLFILIANPNPTAATIEARFLLPSGMVVTRNYFVNANSRFNIWVDTVDARLADTAVSTTIQSTNGVSVIAERAMWWPGPTSTAWQEAHHSPGSTVTGTKWAIAEGEVGGPRSTETYILFANTSASSSDEVQVTLYFEDGTTATKRFLALANARVSVDVRGQFPLSIGRRFGAIVESRGALAPGGPVPLVVERAMYSNAAGIVWAAGTNALATRLQ